jgi:opacity protein-like surface antigen
MKKINRMLLIILIAVMFHQTFAQSNSFLKNRITVEGMYLRNLGNFGDVWSNAAGGYVGYGIAFPEHNYLMLRIGYINNKLKDGVNYDNASLSIMPLEVGGRYYFTDSRFMPFIQFINGLNLISENTTLDGEIKDETLVRYAWQVGFGITINIVNNLSFDIGVNYQSNFYNHDAMNTGFEYAAGFGISLEN